MTHVFLTHDMNCSANNFLDILLVYCQMDKKKISAMQIVTPKSQFHLLGFCAKTEENSGYFGAAQYTDDFKQVYAITVVFRCPFVLIIAVGSFVFFVFTSLTIFQLIHILAFSIVLLFSVTQLFENHVSLVWHSLIIGASQTPHSKFSGESGPGPLVFQH